MPWIHNPAALQDILTAIRLSTSRSIAVRMGALQKLNEFTLHPEYLAYLVHILSCGPGQEEGIRTIAGLLFKNKKGLIASAPAEVIDYVQQALLESVTDPSASIRRTAGQGIVALLDILDSKKSRSWAQCLQYMLSALESSDVSVLETAISTLDDMCEDYPCKLLNIEIAGMRSMEYMIQKFLHLSEHPSCNIRSRAIACLLNLVTAGLQSQLLHCVNVTDIFLACLLKRTSDDDASVRLKVCEAFLLLLETRPAMLLPVMPTLGKYMLQTLRDDDEVALQSCEFWLAFAEHLELAPSLGSLLQALGPTLLDCMVHGEDALFWLKGDVEDAACPAEDADIRGGGCGKGHSSGLDEAGEISSTESEVCVQMQEELLADADEEGEEEGNDSDCDADDPSHDITTDWTLRNCASATLDVLAQRFRGQLLDYLLCPLKDKLWSSDWLQVESGILALGVVAKACTKALEPHLPVLITYLLNALDHSDPLVRSITCWTLGRYAGWCSQSITEEHKTNFFIPTMKGLLCMALDEDRKVQQEGCRALAELGEKASQDLLQPHLELVFRRLILALGKYQRNNLSTLYDVIGSIADAAGQGALGSPLLTSIVMPSLLERWFKTADDSEISMLRCLSSVTLAIGLGFSPFAAPVYERCMIIIHTCIGQHGQYLQFRDSTVPPDKEILVVALEVLSGLTQGLGLSMNATIRGSEGHLLQLLTTCLKHPEGTVRKAACALVGHMAVNCFSALRPATLPDIMTELIVQLKPVPGKSKFSRAANGAACSIGELAVQFGEDHLEFRQWVYPLVCHLGLILQHSKASRALQNDAAVTICRIGLMHPRTVAPHLASFAQACCRAFCEILNNQVKVSAFRGLCLLIEVNPAGIAPVQNLVWLCRCIVEWEQPSQEVVHMCRVLVRGLRSQDPQGWTMQISTFPPALQKMLQERGY